MDQRPDAGISRTSSSEDLGQQVRDTGSQVKDQVSRQASERFSQQKERAAGSLHAVADAVRMSGDRLQEQNPSIAELSDTVAERIERIATHIDTEDLGQLVSDAERLARRQPVLFLGGTFALGVLAARFFKSKDPDASSDWRNDQFSGYRRGNEFQRSNRSDSDGQEFRSRANPAGFEPTVAGHYSERPETPSHRNAPDATK